MDFVRFARVSRLALVGSLLSGSFLSGTFLDAQQPLPVGQPIAPAPADPAIAAALQQVSPDNIKAIIAKLVTFNNRSTISSMETDLAPGTGVSAAADWIESEFKRTSQACGCLSQARRLH